MDKFDRIQQLHRIFKSRRKPISTRALAEELEVAEITIKRNCQHLIDIHNAPLIHKPRRGWQYDDPGNTFELVGTWLTSEELIGLSSLLTILKGMESDFINDELDPVREHIEKILVARHIAPKAFANRIKIIATNKQIESSSLFNTVSNAMLARHQLMLSYQGYNGAKTQRTISPQKLIHYQENWYLDCYCHLRNGLRSFKLSRMLNAIKLTTKAKQIPQNELNAYFTSSYGMFSGKAKHTARLRFHGDAAREVAMQQWHAQQTREWDGHDYLISFPYNDDRELIRDILKHANNVEVIGPAKLKHKIQNIAKSVLGMYTARRIH